MEIEIIKKSAQDLGFDTTTIADILEQWGPEVLGLLVETARGGITIAFILEVIQKFGPIFLQFAVDLLNKKKSMAIANHIYPVLGTPNSTNTDPALMDLIAEKYSPGMLQIYTSIN